MQNLNPSHNPYPSLLQQLLERTFLGARPASTGAAPTPEGIPGAQARRGDHAGDDDTGLGVDGADDAGDPADAAGRLELAELLGVMRAPIDWVFTLAERHAQGDPVDIAVIHRVRDAVLHRLDATIGGAAPDESQRIRSTDLVIVGSHLLGTLDPMVVQRAMQIVGTHIAEVFTSGLSLDPSLADLEHAEAPSPDRTVPTPIPPSWYLGGIPARPVPPCGCGTSMPHTFAPYGGHYGGPLAALHAPRPAVPPWYWHSFPFAF